MSTQNPPKPQGPFIDTQSRPLPRKAVLLVAPVTTFYILGIISVGLRVWAKRIKKISIRLSDYAIFVAASFATAFVALCWLGVESGGLGYPLAGDFIIAWLVQAWANTFVRLSILEFLAHVFRASPFPIVVYVFEALSIAYLVGCTLTFFLSCRPMKYIYVVGPLGQQHCGNMAMKFLLSAIFNLVLDISILILPMPVLWTLHLNSGKKAALTVVFGLGIFVCFATVWRTYNVAKFALLRDNKNFTVTIIENALWSGLEINLGIINACMPVMYPALQRILNFPVAQMLSNSIWKTTTKVTRFTSTDGSGATSTSSQLKSGHIRWPPEEPPKAQQGIFCEHTVDIEREASEGVLLRSMGTTTWVTHPKSSAKSIQIS